MGLRPSTERGTPVAPAAVSGQQFGPRSRPASLGWLSNATYHYRLDATNGEGTTYGRDKTFTTPPAKPMATALPPSLLGSALGIVECDQSTPITARQLIIFFTGRPRAMVPASPFTKRCLARLTATVRCRHHRRAGLGSTYQLRRSGDQYLKARAPAPDATFNTPPANPTGRWHRNHPTKSCRTAQTSLAPSAHKGPTRSYEFDIGTDTTYGSRIFGEARLR